MSVRTLLPEQLHQFAHSFRVNGRWLVADAKNIAPCLFYAFVNSRHVSHDHDRTAIRLTFWFRNVFAQAGEFGA